MRHLLVVLVVGACSGAGDSTIDITHDPCSGVTLAGATDDVQVAGIDGAIALWAERGVTLARASYGDAPTIALQFEEAAGAFHGVYDDERGVILINRELTDPAQLAIVIAHELGHAFGLVHVSDRVSLMNKGNLVTPPTLEDQAALEALWGSCQPTND